MCPSLRRPMAGCLSVVLALAACDSRAGQADASPPVADARPTAGDVAATTRGVPPSPRIDSLLGRFRAATEGRTDSLGGGDSSVASLVRRYVAALEARDTAEIRRLVLSRAEFAWVYYPESRFARRPYELDPDVVWMQLFAASDKGSVRALRKLGGTGARYVSHRCPRPPEPEGRLRLHGCEVTIRAGDDAPTEVRLFGPIVEQAGRFKFLSLDSRI